MAHDYLKDTDVKIVTVIGFPLGANKTEVKVDRKGMSYYDFFDTVSFIYSYTNDDDETFFAKCDEVADILDEYHMMFDIYHEYDGINNLCTINNNAGINAVEVDERLIDFLIQIHFLKHYIGYLTI